MTITTVPVSQIILQKSLNVAGKGPEKEKLFSSLASALTKQSSCLRNVSCLLPWAAMYVFFPWQPSTKFA
jgi:hypothetical protein